MFNCAIKYRHLALHEDKWLAYAWSIYHRRKKLVTKGSCVGATTVLEEHEYKVIPVHKMKSQREADARSGLLNLFCAMDPFESLMKPMDVCSEK